jgi:hypothetical protein
MSERNSFFNSHVPFNLSLRLSLVLFICFCLAFNKYIQSERQIDRANEVRYQSFLLADELRQSSDDLPRMVRTYDTTSEPIYKRHYREIIDIREGTKPRPLDYQGISGTWS